jgi:DNA-directed RNA polymerase subunit beta'
LKENVIVGRLIPAGTGGVLNRLKKLKAGDDRFAPPTEIGPDEDPMRIPAFSDMPSAE